jgi:hypothetical protein
VGVVDKAEQWLLLGGAGQEAECRDADQEAVGWRTGVQANSRFERLALARQQPAESTGQRRHTNCSPE